jgi:predicted transcriptional regulator
MMPPGRDCRPGVLLNWNCVAELNVSEPDQLQVDEDKWGQVLLAAGWTLIPNIIFERQRALGLDPLDINILLHIVSHWSSVSDKPRPSKVTIAKALGVTPRTVQRRIATLEASGLIRRVERRLSKIGSKTNVYHFEGLKKAATPYAAEKLREQKSKPAEILTPRKSRKF